MRRKHHKTKCAQCGDPSANLWSSWCDTCRSAKKTPVEVRGDVYAQARRMIPHFQQGSLPIPC